MLIYWKERRKSDRSQEGNLRKRTLNLSINDAFKKAEKSMEERQILANSLIQVTKSRFEQILMMFNCILAMIGYWKTMDVNIRKSRSGEEITLILINILALLKTNLVMEEKIDELYIPVFNEYLDKYMKEFDGK